MMRKLFYRNHPAAPIFIFAYFTSYVEWRNMQEARYAKNILIINIGELRERKRRASYFLFITVSWLPGCYATPLPASSSIYFYTQ